MIFIIILCLFLIIDLFTGFFFSRFLCGFLVAFPLYLIDIYKMDKEIFRGYGFHIYCGLGGSGKTLSLVYRLKHLRNRYPNLLIMTNFDCKYADKKIESWQDLLSAENFETLEINEKQYKRFSRFKRKGVYFVLDEEGKKHYYYKRNNGVVYGFDEIHLTFESAGWQSAPDNLLDYISQQRKLHKQILASSQVFTRINKKLREQTNIVIDCRSLLGGRLVINKYYNTPEYITNDEKMDKGARKRRVLKREIFVAYNNIRDAYDTEQIMKDLSVPKTNFQQFSGLLERLHEQQ